MVILFQTEPKQWHIFSGKTSWKNDQATCILSIHVARRVVVLMYPAENQLRFMKLLLTWCSISTRWGLRYNPNWKKCASQNWVLSSPQIGVKIKHIWNRHLNLQVPPHILYMDPMGWGHWSFNFEILFWPNQSHPTCNFATFPDRFELRS